MDEGNRRRWSAFAAFAGAYLLSGFLRSSNAVIAEDLRGDLQLTSTQLGLMTAAFLLPFAVAQLPVGAALDRFGARVVVPGLMGVAVAGTLLMAVAPGFLVMALGRGLTGVGLSAILMGGFKALATHFPDRRYTTVSTELVAFGAAGGLLAATPLAWMSDLLGWRTVFALTALALALAAVTVAWFGQAPFPGRPEHREGFTYIFANGRFLRLLCASALSTGVLLAVQGLWAGPYLTNVYGLSQATVGNLLIALNMGLVVGYLTGGWLGRLYGKALVFLVAAAGFLLLQLVLSLQPAVGLTLLTVLFLLFGLTGSFHALLYTLAEELFPARLTGHVVTTVNLAMFTGGFILQTALGLLIETGEADGGGAYGLAFLLTALLSSVALLVMLPELRAEAHEKNDGDSE